ncbi:MAG: DUF4142 domain-containing protein [Spirosoma sp.]|nr:DUF4142 domain-containing protein [Spirosoma sp.]
MKTNLMSALLIAGLLFNTGCSEKKDATDTAEDINDNKIENNSAGTQMANSEGDAKDVAEYMVDLANTGMSELEMSKIAADRATNQSVKDFAKQTVDTHTEDEARLKAEASKYNVTLPSTMSNDAQEMVNKLRDEKAGMDFDKKYLDNMADVNDKAMNKAKNLIDNTTEPALKEFAQKIVTDDQQHMDKAKMLKDALK